jgi:hypothetical protein
MSRFLAGLAAAMSLLALGACGIVRSDIATFHRLTASDRGTIAVVASDPAKRESLEFGEHAARVAAHLARHGFAAAVPGQRPDYIAMLDYGIDDGRSVTRTVSTPITETVYDRPLARGLPPQETQRIAGYSTSTRSETAYTRYVALDIMRADSAGGAAEKLYEARLKSTGSCKWFAAVADQPFAAMFETFPGESGKTRTVRQESPGSC